MSAITLHIGDVFEQLAKIPDGSIDLIVTSPPFLALRSYLPNDHPDKALEIGSESGPAAFLDTMLALSAEWGRVLAPHGSLCVELGDTYSGSGGAGGDYNADGLRDGQGKFSGSAARGDDWPMSKSKTMLDTLYPACLAYGANLLSGEASPAGRWRIRNLIVWARPNPPVGALGDKFRPATSYITVACKSPRRWFDLDAVRGAPSPKTNARTAKGVDRQQSTGKSADDERRGGNFSTLDTLHEVGGSPPLDWHADDHPEDGDWLWKMSPQGFAGSHYATFPLALPTRLIKAMCPERVCTVCGAPSERITKVDGLRGASIVDHDQGDVAGMSSPRPNMPDITRETTGWTDCECSDGGTHWRTGRVLDPFAGSGTTLVAAHNESRDAIGIDLDDRNVAMVEDRLGPLVAACDLTVNTTEVAAALAPCPTPTRHSPPPSDTPHAAGGSSPSRPAANTHPCGNGKRTPPTTPTPSGHSGPASTGAAESASPPGQPPAYGSSTSTTGTPSSPSNPNTDHSHPPTPSSPAPAASTTTSPCQPGRPSPTPTGSPKASTCAATPSGSCTPASSTSTT